MPFQIIVPEDVGPRRKECAGLLRSCREVYLAAFDERAVDSPGELDLAMELSGPGGERPDGAVAMPRDLAVELVRQQADFCTAMGNLVASGEVFDPLNALGRGEGGGLAGRPGG